MLMPLCFFFCLKLLGSKNHCTRRPAEAPMGHLQRPPRPRTKGPVYQDPLPFTADDLYTCLHSPPRCLTFGRTLLTPHLQFSSYILRLVYSGSCHCDRPTSAHSCLCSEIL